MNTKQIDYALELAQVKNFNRAAENLFIFQPSLSYQIQALENEIGLALFLRSGRGAEVTRAVLSDAQEYPRGAEGRHRAGAEFQREVPECSDDCSSDAVVSVLSSRGDEGI
jgi:hypothetical protein